MSWLSRSLEIGKEYFVSLVKHWWVLVITVSFAALGAMQELVPSVKMPTWGWWAVAITGLVVAQFLAWLSMRRERNALRRYNVTQEALAQITEYRATLISMQNEEVNNDTELGQWIERYSRLREDVVQYLSGNINPAESSLFERIGVFPLLQFGQGDLSLQHTHWKSRIIRDHRWLETLTQDYARQRYRPEIERGVQAVDRPPSEPSSVATD